MVRNNRFTVPACLVGLALTAAFAGDARGDDESVQQRLDRMQEQIDLLLQDNARKSTEIDELRAAANEDWLTEQRAEEIRGLVQDVLADADTRTSLLNNGLMAGWSEHFFLASPDGRFKLQLEGMMQFRWMFSYHDVQPRSQNDDQDKFRQGFENTRTKLTLRGHVFGPDLQYLIRGNFNRDGGSFVLEDAWIQYRLTNEWHLRFGQFKLPYMREELVSPARQLAVERSLVNENMSHGRSQGIELIYAADDWKWMFALSDGVEDNLGGFGSLQGTRGPNGRALEKDVEWSITTRYEKLLAGNWQQFDDFTSPPGEEFGLLWGIAGQTQQTERGTSGFNPIFEPVRRQHNNLLAATTDISAEWGGANAFASFSYSYNDTAQFGQITIYGIVLQGGVYVAPKWELYGRWQYGWWDFTNADFSDLHAATVGFNHYLDGHDAKWTTDFGFGVGKIDGNWDSDIAGWRADQDGADPQLILRSQFQLLF